MYMLKVNPGYLIHDRVAMTVSISLELHDDSPQALSETLSACSVNMSATSALSK